MKEIVVIGSGFGSLSAACFLAKKGHKVSVFEKNESLGGRCSQYKADGFTFDMGPSWYWMPEVFENFFNAFGKKTEDFYELIRLDPSYRVVFGKDDYVDLPSDYTALKALFDNIEPGSSKKLDEFLAEAEYKYKVGMTEFVWKPGDSIMEFADWRVVKSMFKLGMLQSISSEIKKKFKNPKLIKILEFPVLFLGATPEKTPALYSLMNYADLKLGTWYPMGGMYEIIKAMVNVAEAYGVKFYTNSPVKKINVSTRLASSIILLNGEIVKCDTVIAGADYHHVEQNLLQQDARMYDEAYWSKRVMAPSSLLFYIGIDRKVDGLKHHTLFFDRDFKLHAQEIYEDPKWPSDPLFYMCSPSVTDKSVAPEGFENIFLLMPLAPGLEDAPKLHEKYFNLMCERIEEFYGVDIRKHIIHKKSFCLNEFKSRYNAFKGNAYGLANTLMQTAFLKPKIKSTKVNNLYYTGQLTSPGPGMPPSIISGQVVANMID
ncbi:MAG TPA: phytoene desaturase family protein [Saprospiraceae bacterium]|nr:phytoene desaturase family protein [Saprospiraceae bacterium]